MRILGLKGFGRFEVGRIAKHFQDGFFPWRYNWSGRSLEPVMKMYTEMYGDDPFICIGFSDGGTLAHRVAAYDERCQALIVHSGMFDCVKARNIPILLMRTQGDRTPTYKATGFAHRYYTERVITELSPLVELQSEEDFFHHQFANGLETIKLWCQQKLGFDVPIRHHWVIKYKNGERQP